MGVDRDISTVCCWSSSGNEESIKQSKRRDLHPCDNIMRQTISKLSGILFKVMSNSLLIEGRHKCINPSRQALLCTYIDNKIIMIL